MWRTPAPRLTRVLALPAMRDDRHRADAPAQVTSGMKGGGFYDVHSEYQRRVVEGGDPLIRSVIAGLDPASGRAAFAVADYGAGTGATSAHAVGVAISALRERHAETAVWALHNDVLSNDFTQLFATIAGPQGYLGLPGGPIYPAAIGGSFFEQVAPDATIDLGMCSNAAHWFREQPDLELPGGLYFSEASGETRRRLAEQAADDWLAFLGARAAELTPGGALVVQGIATVPAEGGGEHVSASKLLEVMSRVAGSMVAEGSLDEPALRRYVYPVYCRSRAEATAPLAAGAELADAFELSEAIVEEVPNPYWEMLERDGDVEAYADAYTAFVRAFAEATMVEQLLEPAGRRAEPGALCDELFARFRAATADDPERGRYEAWILRLALRRR